MKHLGLIRFSLGAALCFGLSAFRPFLSGLVLSVGPPEFSF